MEIKNPTRFAEILVSNYLNQGFVSMAKRDLDLLLLYALCEDGQYSFPKDFHLACRQLKLSEAKLRGMLKDMQLRYNPISGETAIQKFVDIVQNQEFDIDGSRISFIVRDPMLRIYIEEWIAKASCFSDTSFNPNVVKMTYKGFEKLINFAFENSSSNKDLPKPILAELRKQNGKTPGEIFLDSFCSSAGEKTGVLAIHTLAQGLGVLLRCLIA